jgi:hypothetical protein
VQCVVRELRGYEARATIVDTERDSPNQQAVILIVREDARRCAVLDAWESTARA